MRTIEFRAYWVDTKKPVEDFNDEYVISACNDEVFIIQQFTGFLDRYKNKIFEGDILSDYTQPDEGVVKSFQQVFWCERTGAWMLDESYKQDKSASRLLSKELQEFAYEISGNIHETPELLQVAEMKITRE